MVAPSIATAWKRVIALGGLAAVCAIAVIAGCKDSSTPADIATFLVVSPDSVALVRFDSVTLTAAVLNQDSVLMTGLSIAFHSNDTAIAKVSVLGVVRSTGPVGATTVTVTAAGLTKNVPVKVTTAAVSITASPLDTAVKQAASYQLRTVVKDAFGDSVTNAPRVFLSLDTAVAAVSASGVVTAKAAGQATLRVSSGALFTFATVTSLDSNIIARVPLANAPYGVAASSAGVVYIAPILGPSVRRLDMTTFTLTDAIAVGGDPAQVAFAGAGATALVTKRASGSVGILDVATHAQVDTIAVPGNPYPIRISADGLTAYVTNTSGMLYKIDIASRTRVDSVATPGPSLQIALGPADSLLYISQSGGSVTEVRTTTMAVVRTFTTGGTPQGLAVSQDGAELYIADESGPLRIWSLASATEIDTVSTGGGTFGVALTPDGTKLFVGTSAGSIFLINRVTRAIIHRVDVGGTPRNIAVHPLTGYAVVPNEAANRIDVVK